MSITIKATDLRDLLAPVIPHASTDRTLPLLNSVLIRSAGEYVTASATNRYALALHRMKPEAVEPGFRAVVPVASIKRLLTIFKATRANDPILSLTADDSTLTVSTVGVLDDGMGGSLTFPLCAGVYPATDRLIAKALAHQQAEPAPVIVNPAFLADFAKGQPRHEPICVSHGGMNGAGANWLIRIGEDFVGLLTGIRFAAPPEVTSPWADLLDTEADKEATR
jgi:hypothetical protein